VFEKWIFPRSVTENPSVYRLSDLHTFITYRNLERQGGLRIQIGNPILMPGKLMTRADRLCGLIEMQYKIKEYHPDEKRTVR
jgi:hypothetical protein